MPIEIFEYGKMVSMRVIIFFNKKKFGINGKVKELITK